MKIKKSDPISKKSSKTHKKRKHQSSKSKNLTRSKSSNPAPPNNPEDNLETSQKKNSQVSFTSESETNLLLNKHESNTIKNIQSPKKMQHISQPVNRTSSLNNIENNFKPPNFSISKIVKVSRNKTK